MDLRRVLARPSTFGRSVARYARAVCVSVYLSARRLTGRYHQGWRTSSFPLDDRRHRRSVKMVQRNRIARRSLQDTFDQIPKELNSVTQSFALASALVRGFFGEEWWDRHVLPNRRKPGFLTMNETNPTTLDM